jgi:sec-independent protein translocase protein TatB
MFDLSWSHIAILVVVALIVLGPKELPNAIRTGAQLLRAGRKLAGEFRSGVDELVREAELDETRRTITQAMTEGIDNTIGETVEPFREIKASLQGDLMADQPAADRPAADQPAAELPGPSNIVINDAPPAPPNSIVPPPPEGASPETAGTPSADVSAPMSSEPALAPSAGPAAASEDLKKSA